jgi:hypothetical protein
MQKKITLVLKLKENKRSITEYSNNQNIWNMGSSNKIKSYNIKGAHFLWKEKKDIQPSETLAF